MTNPPTAIVVCHADYDFDQKQLSARGERQIDALKQVLRQNDFILKPDATYSSRRARALLTTEALVGDGYQTSGNLYTFRSPTDTVWSDAERATGLQGVELITKVLSGPESKPEKVLAQRLIWFKEFICRGTLQIADTLDEDEVVLFVAHGPLVEAIGLLFGDEIHEFSHCSGYCIEVTEPDAGKIICPIEAPQ